jgi:hypothetical protein
VAKAVEAGVASATASVASVTESVSSIASTLESSIEGCASLFKTISMLVGAYVCMRHIPFLRNHAALITALLSFGVPSALWNEVKGLFTFPPGDEDRPTMPVTQAMDVPLEQSDVAQSPKWLSQHFVSLFPHCGA